MAIVETLELRFVAKLGSLSAQIATVTAALSGLGGASSAVMATVAAASIGARRAMDGMNLSTRTAEKSQSRLSSKLKKTSRAFKGVSNAAKQAAEGIGLHKMDEINLVDDQEQNKSSGGGSKGGSAAGTGREADGLARIKELLSELPGFFERFHSHVRRNMKGVDELINKATGGLAGKLIKLLGSAGKNAAVSMVDKLLEHFNTSRPELASKGQSLMQAVADALKNGASATAAPTQAGTTMVGKLVSGILSGQTSAQSAASSVTQAAKFGGESAKSAASSAGLDLSMGFAGGMLSYIDKIKTAAGKLASAALSKLKDLLKISSPSKVTFAMGEFFSQGFAGGIASAVNLARSSASTLAGASLMALNGGNMHIGSESSVAGMVRSAVNEALGGTSITIPLNVDGVKLGEASIRGINRVTRASGRLMLEI